MKKLIIIILFLLIGCVDNNKPLPEGEIISAPVGYIIYCRENPDSIFCKKDGE